MAGYDLLRTRDSQKETKAENVEISSEVKQIAFCMYMHKLCKY